MVSEPIKLQGQELIETKEAIRGLRDAISLKQQRIADLEKSLSKIDAIRNSIIGYHKISWSAHIYPLVAALGEAGYKGIGYEEAKKQAITQIERIAKLEQKLTGLQAHFALPSKGAVND